jgi:pyrimidine operon attenuation protein/uracil phosphoribosyltransferase
MDTLRDKRVVLDDAAISRTVERMAMEILERHQGGDNLALVGIHTAGVPLAHRLAARMKKTADLTVPVGMVDITLYRDDVFIGLPHPIVGRTELPFDITGRPIVLVDDVLFTGRTIRAALDALMDFGRPKCIELAVLIDRGFRELPIQADVVGQALQTTPNESVKVMLSEMGTVEDQVMLREKP